MNTSSCFFCRENAAQVVDRRTRKQLAILWKGVGREISEEHLVNCDCPEIVHLYRCRSCGFEYHDPRFAGDGRFYEKLNEKGDHYYVDDREEFRWALKVMTKPVDGKILDVGCGNGAFLDRAGEVGWVTHGLEVNEVSAEITRSRGHKVFNQLLDESFASENREYFDAVTFFQVVEHLSDPVSVLQTAKKLLKPGGFLIVAVPNFSGLGKFFTHDPHHWPPHHVSRWKRHHLRDLGTKLGLNTICVSGDVLYGGAITQLLRLEVRLKAAINKPQGVINHSTARLIGRTYSILGFKHIFKTRGLSHYGLYQKLGTK